MAVVLAVFVDSVMRADFQEEYQRQEMAALKDMDSLGNSKFEVSSKFLAEYKKSFEKVIL